MKLPISMLDLQENRFDFLLLWLLLYESRGHR